jgi:hypothetical protein
MKRGSASGFQESSEALRPCPHRRGYHLLGLEIGYLVPLGSMHGYLNLKGYGEFAAINRPSGWNLWLTFAILPES